MTVPLAPLERPEVPTPTFGDRSGFPKLWFDAYLGHAAISPVGRAVEAHVSACLDDVSSLGAGAYPIWALSRKRLRSDLETLLDVESETVALTAGTSYGITALATALPWRSGERLLSARGEFPANVTPWQLAAARAGGVVDFLPEPAPNDPRAAEIFLGFLETELRRGARYVALSAVQFQSGFRMPLQEIGRLCRLYNAWFLVDGIQAVGTMKLAVRELGIHAVTGGGHKWLLGTEGAGFLYVAPELQAVLLPLTAGWLSHEDGENFLFQGAGLLRYDRALKTNALVFEGSSPSLLSYAALEAGLAQIMALGPAAIFQHVQKYHDAIEGGFCELGFRSLRAEREENRSCLLCFESPKTLVLAKFAAALREQKVMVSTPDGRVRLAPHYANSLEEVPKVLAAVRQALG